MDIRITCLPPDWSSDAFLQAIEEFAHGGVNWYRDTPPAFDVGRSLVWGLGLVDELEWAPEAAQKPAPVIT